MDVWPWIAATVWFGTGLITGAWMVRRGHDRLWVIVAVALGPLFVPIALERVERRPRVAYSGGDRLTDRRAGATGSRVLVGIDGSPESERALAVALDLVRGEGGQLVLAEVVSYDATEPDEPEAVDLASRHLDLARASVPDVPVHLEVLAGPPGTALARYAEDNDLDVIVVGRRGRGLSGRLLGSVTDHLVHHSAVPVLVVEPRRETAGGAADSGNRPASRS